MNVIIYQLSRYNISQFVKARGAKQKSEGGDEEVRPIRIRPMEAAKGDGVEACRAEQKSGGGSEGGEEEEAQTVS